jgi:tRNA G18 (ribose-2'-O)-methylase SpoU
MLVECLEVIRNNEHLGIKQVTYIGSATALGSTSVLARVAGSVEVVHQVHPREIWPDWEERLRRGSKVLPKALARTYLLGEF